MNKRYSLQQSIFISTGISHIPLMEQLKFLGDGIKESVIKIEIPSEQKKFVLRDLQQMNLYRASLFPDLDGYAASMKLRYDSMQSPDEKRQEEMDKHKDKDYPFIP
ncbi:MAG: hypothetical protein ACXWCZ_07835 [Flavisolibacter sp.]